MATKDWIFIRETNSHLFMWENKKSPLSIQIDELKDDRFRVDVYKFEYVEDNQGHTWINKSSKKFDTQAKALAYADNFRRSH